MNGGGETQLFLLPRDFSISSRFIPLFRAERLEPIFDEDIPMMAKMTWNTTKIRVGFENYISNGTKMTLKLPNLNRMTWKQHEKWPRNYLKMA